MATSRNTSVKITGMNNLRNKVKETMDKDYEFILNKLKKKLDDIAQGAYEIMVQAISSGKDSQGKLEKFLYPKFTITPNGIQFVIGDKETLNKEVPYWYVLNYGIGYRTKRPYVPPINIGYYEGNTWVHTGEHITGKETRLLEPSAITPIPYIDLANNYIIRELDKIKL